MIILPTSTCAQATLALSEPDAAALADSVLTPENRFMAAALGGQRNCFLTGMAGTGKSTMLRKFIKESSRRVDITAPTGVAALNVGGSTIHRFCGMMLGPQNGQTNEEYFTILENDHRPSIKAGFRRITRCQCLVIDEVSMLPGRQFEFVEFLFRRLRDTDAPFGGCQVIATGDFLQLPPVRTDERNPYDWAFSSQTWAASEFKTINLEIVRRQDEKNFVRALADFRRGRVTGDSARLLQSRVRSNPPSAMPRLFTHNVQVDRWNNYQLGDLPGDETVIEAVQTGPDNQRAFLTKNLLTPATLRLKPGAFVMFTINRIDPETQRLLHVNGQTGIVESISADADFSGRRVNVVTPHHGTIAVEPFTWKFDQKAEDGATFQQFPLRLAWAMTIHKSQGITLDSAYLDIRAAREPGQAYVAVSRVRTLAGLNFKDWFRGVFVSNEAIEFYKKICS